MQDQGDDQYAEPPLPKDERVHLIHYDEAEFYVLPFSFYALGIRCDVSKGTQFSPPAPQ